MRPVIRVCVCLSLYLFNGEIVDQVVVVFIEAAVQRDTVGVKEQVLRKKVPKRNQPSKLPLRSSVVNLSLRGINLST